MRIPNTENYIIMWFVIRICKNIYPLCESIKKLCHSLSVFPLETGGVFRSGTTIPRQENKSRLFANYLRLMLLKLKEIPENREAII